MESNGSFNAPARRAGMAAVVNASKHTQRLSILRAVYAAAYLNEMKRA